MRAAIRDLRSFDFSLIFPWATIQTFSWLKEHRMILLGVVGLAPIIALVLAPSVLAAYWGLALYFSCLWALFFYHLLQTPQIRWQICALCFATTAVVSISLLTLAYQIWPISALFSLAQSDSLPIQAAGMLLGVAIPEELCKAAILFWLLRRPNSLLSPQTVVLMGMISGLGFGIHEGVNYQTGLNKELGIDGAYFLNIARLTSLPFLHAIWTGMAGYFIAFASLHPRRRRGLWVLAIGVPACFHATYNILGWDVLGLGSAALGVVVLTIYLSSANTLHERLSSR